MVADARFFRFVLEQLQWFVNRLVRQAECAVVHGNHPAGVQIEKGASGVGGVGVDVAKRGRIVGTDRKQRQLGTEALADFSEAGEVSGVSSVINGVLTGFENVASVAAVGVF